MLQQSDLSVLEALGQITDISQLTNSLRVLTNLKKPTINRSIKRLQKKYNTRIPLTLRYHKIGMSLILTLVSINPRNLQQVKPYLDNPTRIHQHRLFGGEELWDFSFYVMPPSEIRKFNKKMNQLRSWNWIRSSIIKPIEYFRSNINFHLYNAETGVWEIPNPKNQDRPSLVHIDTTTGIKKLHKEDRLLLEHLQPDITQSILTLTKAVNLKPKEIRSRLTRLASVYDVHTIMDFHHLGLDQQVLLRLDDLVSVDLYDVRSYVSSFPSFEIASSLTEGGVTSLFILLRFPLSQATDYFESILPHFTKFHAAETIYFETATTTSLIPPIAFP